MASIQHFSVSQGAVFEAVVTVTNTVDGTPVDLTDFTGTSQIRKSYGSRNPSVEFSVVINNPTAGEIILSLTDEQTESLKGGRYVYDVFVENSSNDRFKAIEGTVTVISAATLRV